MSLRLRFGQPAQGESVGGSEQGKTHHVLQQGCRQSFHGRTAAHPRRAADAASGPARPARFQTPGHMPGRSAAQGIRYGPDRTPPANRIAGAAAPGRRSVHVLPRHRSSNGACCRRCAARRRWPLPATGIRMVAGDHDDPYAGVQAVSHGLRDIRPERVGQRHQSHQLIAARCRVVGPVGWRDRRARDRQWPGAAVGDAGGVCLPTCRSRLYSTGDGISTFGKRSHSGYVRCALCEVNLHSMASRAGLGSPIIASSFHNNILSIRT